MVIETELFVLLLQKQPNRTKLCVKWAVSDLLLKTQSKQLFNEAGWIHFTHKSQDIQMKWFIQCDEGGKWEAEDESTTNKIHTNLFKTIQMRNLATVLDITTKFCMI